MEHGRQGSSNERSVKLTMTCFGVAALLEHVRFGIARVSPQRADRAGEPRSASIARIRDAHHMAPEQRSHALCRRHRS